MPKPKTQCETLFQPSLERFYKLIRDKIHKKNIERTFLHTFLKNGENCLF